MLEIARMGWLRRLLPQQQSDVKSLEKSLVSEEANYFDIPPPSSSDSKIIMEGILKKEAGSHRNWKLRYFRLDTDAFCYYKPDSSTPAGVIPLEEILEAMKSKESFLIDENCFEVATVGRTYYLIPQDATSVDMWIEAINLSVGNAKRRLPSLEKLNKTAKNLHRKRSSESDMFKKKTLDAPPKLRVEFKQEMERDRFMKEASFVMPLKSIEVSDSQACNVSYLKAEQRQRKVMSSNGVDNTSCMARSPPKKFLHKRNCSEPCPFQNSEPDSGFQSQASSFDDICRNLPDFALENGSLSS